MTQHATHVDRQDTKTPTTERGRRTRAKLVDAARTIFESDGFIDARITDIARTAGVAYGTFYTYFTSKEEIFGEVARAVQREMLLADQAPVASSGPEPTTAAERIERANRRYLESYQRNARLMAVIEQNALRSPELLEIRREIRRAFVERSTQAIAAWQRQGLADPELDPRYAASALGSMVDRFAYVWLVLEDDFELERAVSTLTRLWVHALGLQADATLPTRPASTPT
jgi:AcrR family transcriptional regulator